MTPHKLDRTESERFDRIFERLHAGDEDCFANFFRSERVAKEASAEKVVLPSFDEDKIFSVLPFSPALYVCICPLCIDEENFERFKELVSRGLIVPIFQAHFSSYPDELIDIAVKYDSVSRAEFRAFRYICMPNEHFMNICSCCSQRMFEDMVNSIQSRRNRDAYLRCVYAVQDNSFPYHTLDIDLIKNAQRACLNNRLSRLEDISRLSFAINELKTSLAFNSPLLIDDSDIETIPNGLHDSIDRAKAELVSLKADAVKSLGLEIPSGMPVGAYAELMQDYQPRIAETIKGIVENDAIGSRELLNQEVIRLNSEMRSIRNLKRFHLLQATMNFWTQGDELVKAAVFGATLLPFSSWLGCAAAGGLIAKKLLKAIDANSSQLAKNPSLARLRQSIIRDLQPYTDAMCGAYLQSSSSAIKIISLQNTINARTRQQAA